MKAEEFVKQHYPKAIAFPMIDNLRRQTSYVIVKGTVGLEIFENYGATTASKAWTNAKKDLLKTHNNIQYY